MSSRDTPALLGSTSDTEWGTGRPGGDKGSEAPSHQRDGRSHVSWSAGSLALGEWSELSRLEF